MTLEEAVFLEVLKQGMRMPQHQPAPDSASQATVMRLIARACKKTASDIVEEYRGHPIREYRPATKILDAIERSVGTASSVSYSQSRADASVLALELMRITSATPESKKPTGEIAKVEE